MSQGKYISKTGFRRALFSLFVHRTLYIVHRVPSPHRGEGKGEGGTRYEIRDTRYEFRSIIPSLVPFLVCFLFFLPLISEAQSSAPIVRIKILEGRESITAGATGSYQIESGGRKIRSYSSSTSPRRIEATSSGIRIDGILWGKQIWIKPKESDSLSLVNGRRYRGSLLVKQKEDFLEVINELFLEEYLYGVIEREVSSSWPFDVLCAQTIAARTYALEKRELERLVEDQDHHLSWTTEDQVYGGVESETRQARRAVDDTQGKVITYQGESIKAFYHNCCGGHTVSSGDVWGGEDFPYLRVGPDEFCKESPYYKWEWEIDVSELRKVLVKEGFSVGKIYRLQVLTRT
ncbi:SpoIID/LytB domain-containing protein, partial [Candidatus Aerophobetes bacterium]